MKTIVDQMAEEKWKEESSEIKKIKKVCVFKERQNEQTKEIKKKKDRRKQTCKKKETERRNRKKKKREIKNNECVKILPESNIQKWQ